MLLKAYHKQKILKPSIEKVKLHRKITSKNHRVLLTNYASAKKWKDIIKVLRENNCQPRVAYPDRYISKVKAK